MCRMAILLRLSYIAISKAFYANMCRIHYPRQLWKSTSTWHLALLTEWFVRDGRCSSKTFFYRSPNWVGKFLEKMCEEEKRIHSILSIPVPMQKVKVIPTLQRSATSVMIPWMVIDVVISTIATGSRGEVAHSACNTKDMMGKNSHPLNL